MRNTCCVALYQFPALCSSEAGTLLRINTQCLRALSIAGKARKRVRSAPGRRLERLEELAKRGLATVFIQSESYQNRRSVSGGATHSLHSDHRVRKCNYSNLLLMCAGNSRWNYNRNGNRSWCVGIGYCNLYRCHHKLCRIGVFREIHRISELWNS